MTLEEQLAMATEAVPVQPAPVQPVQNVAPVQPTQAVPVQQVISNPAPVGVQPTQAVAPAQPVTPVQPVQATTVAPVQTVNLEQAQQEAEVNYSVQSIEIGQKISSRAIEPFKKLDKGESVRITVLNTTDWKAAKVHNHPELGKIICWGGQCCKDSDARVRYFLPVMVYSTLPGDINTPLPQAKSELRLLILWDSESYDSLCQCLIDNNMDVSAIDLRAKSIDNYGKLQFTPLPSFRSQFQEPLKEAMEKWEIVKDKAIQTVGRTLNDERYLKLTQTAAVPTMESYNMNDIME